VKSEGPDPYLYRGTTRGWPGTESNRSTGTTCTTTDPLVAAFFAIECRNKGHAVLLVMQRGLITEVEENHFAIFEGAVNLSISPSEFEARAERSIDIDRAIGHLGAFGLRLPVRIQGNTALHDLLKDTYAEGLRLSLGQINRFNELWQREEP
jgi:hypothetical protein